MYTFVDHRNAELLNDSKTDKARYHISVRVSNTSFSHINMYKGHHSSPVRMITIPPLLSIFEHKCVSSSRLNVTIIGTTTGI